MDNTASGTAQKALKLNLDAITYGTFAEIGPARKWPDGSFRSAAQRERWQRPVRPTTWRSATQSTARPSAT